MDENRPKKPRSFLTRHVHSYMFDTVWDMALTLNKSLPILKAMNSSLDKMPFQNKGLTDQLIKIAFATKFEGITVSIMTLIKHMHDTLTVLNFSITYCVSHNRSVIKSFL